MPAPTLPRLIVIVGPTAGGKSELAVALAQRLAPGGQVLSADSMQVYRHMDAGTAKPPRKLRELAPHHLIDIVEPTQRFTVAHWLARAEPLITAILEQGRWPIVVGGTNLYIKALLEGMFEGPAIDPELRARLATHSGPELHARLQQVDPVSAQRIHPNDQKKLIRALEVHQLTGQTISQHQRQWSEDALAYHHHPILLGLEWPTPVLNQRINARVKEMFTAGDRETLPAETQRLEAAGLLGPQAREALGYKQVLAFLAGQGTLEDALEQTKILTRRFAKTQRTWLKRYRGVTWLPGWQHTAEQLSALALEAIARENQSPDAPDPAPH